MTSDELHTLLQTVSERNRWPPEQIIAEKKPGDVALVVLNADEWMDVVAALKDATGFYRQSN